MPGLQVLEPGVGYGLIIGIGIAFSAIMVALTFIQNRFTKHNTWKSSEEFNTASRSLPPGMIASGVVSAWTHATTLLTSCVMAYSYGVSGALWYGAFGSLQILLFALTAARVKERSNDAHTFPEIVLAKHGRTAHKIYVVFGLITNIINGAALVVGGCAVFTALSGMNIWASYFIVILIVEGYIVVGGLRSTFISDYLHTVFLFVIILIFMFAVYTTSPHIGSIENMYNMLQDHSSTGTGRKADTENGSFFQVRSIDSLVFGITILLAGPSAVWTNQAYWQRAIASQPLTAARGYILGSIAWYGIPLALCTSMGLAAAALRGRGEIPVELTATQVSAGLVGPAAAVALFGKSGACLIMVLVFLAVTSSASGESIAASSLITFDIYKAYINPRPSPRSLLWVSIAGFFIFGMALAAVCCVFQAVGVSLNWLIKIFGCLLGGGFFPIVAVVFWDRTSTFAAQVSPIIGLSSGMTAWLVTTKIRSGAINIVTTGNSYNAIAGDAVAIGMGGISILVFTYLFPERRPITLEVEIVSSSATSKLSNEKKVNVEEDVSAYAAATTKAPHGSDLDHSLPDDEPLVPISAMTKEEARPQKRLAQGVLVFHVLVLMILIPFTLYGTSYTFSLGFFKAYVAISFIWIWCSAMICVVLPVWESREGWMGIIKTMIGK